MPVLQMQALQRKHPLTVTACPQATPVLPAFLDKCWWTSHEPLANCTDLKSKTMATPLAPEEIDRIAEKRTRAKLGWYTHAVVYVLVNLFIFAVSNYGFGTRNWSLGPLLGWGLGLALHGISVFFLGVGGELRDRMVQRERERIQRQQDRQ